MHPGTIHFKKPRALWFRFQRPITLQKWLCLWLTTKINHDNSFFHLHFSVHILVVVSPCALIRVVHYTIRGGLVELEAAAAERLQVSGKGASIFTLNSAVRDKLSPWWSCDVV